ATRAALRARSALMRNIRSCLRVRRRLGIISPRSPDGSPGGRITVGGGGSSPVGTHSIGSSSRLPGRVVYVWPLGEVQTTVPSGCCSSRQAVQNVLSKWCFRHRHFKFEGCVRPSG